MCIMGNGTDPPTFYPGNLMKNMNSTNSGLSIGEENSLLNSSETNTCGMDDVLAIDGYQVSVGLQL